MSKTSGQECPECGNRARSLYTAHDEDGRVVRQRVCPEGHKFSTVEVPVRASFHRMAVDRDNRRRKRASLHPSYRPRNPVVVRFSASYGAGAGRVAGGVGVDATYRSDVGLPRQDEAQAEAMRYLTEGSRPGRVDD